MLTDMAIRALPAPEKGVKRYWDKDGLCLQVSQGGTKTFYYVHGANRKFQKLGRYPKPLSLAAARQMVEKIIAKRTLGIEDETSRTTVKEAVEDFIAKHCEVKNKPRTVQDAKYLLAYLAPLGKRSIAAVRTADVLEVIEKSSESVSTRRHIFAATRTFFRWVQRQRIIWLLQPYH